MFYSYEESILRKIFSTSCWEISVSCAIHDYDTLLSNFCFIISQVVTYGRLKTKENLKLLALKVVQSLMRGGCLQEVPNIVIWLWNFCHFGKLVAEERWSLMRGGRNQRLHCPCRGHWRSDRSRGNQKGGGGWVKLQVTQLVSLILLYRAVIAQSYLVNHVIPRWFS